MTNLPNIKVEDRLLSDLSANDQECLFIAANILMQWLLQEAEKRKEAEQPIMLLGSGE